MSNVFIKNASGPLGAAVFMSGTGSNAEKILEHHAGLKDQAAWKPLVVVTDNPVRSRAREIATAYGLPIVELDIADFYRSCGMGKVSIATEEGRRVREMWTDELRSMLSGYKIDFGILAGFVPLTNIVTDFPCLNIHPGDLTFEVDSHRWLVGLHTVPIERAILCGHDTLRSSVIVVQPYTPGASEMDSGPILGISEPVGIDMAGHTLDDFRRAAAGREGKHRPPGGFRDILSETASLAQERLKVEGDWVLFPRVVEDFASGNFNMDENNELLFRDSGKWARIRTVEYGREKYRIILPS